MGALDGLDRLSALADPIAGAWSGRARSSTTLGRERAILRAFGVGGLDREGRPLAWAVVDRWLGGQPARLASGLTLPFTVALLEYDLSPQDLALDVASGAIDLALEAQLLEVPERRAAAESEARRLGRLALERIDANRTARRELRDILGDADQPWLGVSLAETTTRAAAWEAEALIRDGVDLLRVRVPTGRELALRLLDLGLDDEAESLDSNGATPEEDLDEAPVGSQRGLGALRGVLDERAAERGAYVGLATAAPALSAPEQAVVATFERIDVVEADPFREIVEAGVEPDRALADHAFAHRLHRRAGSLVEVGPGPLVVGPDLARGLPSDPATRSGRALALELLAVRLAIADGLDARSVAVAALPDWLLDEVDVARVGLAEVAVRRALFGRHPLAFDAPAPRSADDRGLVETWSHLVAATLPLASPTAFVTRPRPLAPASVGRVHSAMRVVGEAVGDGLEARPLRGRAAEHATATISAAIATLEALADQGWDAILGEEPDENERPRLGADTVVEAAEAFDPFE